MPIQSRSAIAFAPVAERGAVLVEEFAELSAQRLGGGRRFDRIEAECLRYHRPSLRGRRGHVSLRRDASSVRLPALQLRGRVVRNAGEPQAFSEMIAIARALERRRSHEALHCEVRFDRSESPKHDRRFL
jgi:hypothetical protein